jgi:spastin
LDDAVLRRLVKRIYVPLPDSNVRKLLFKTKLKCQPHSLSDGDIDKIVKETEGYSGSDLQALCEEAAMMPIRELGANILTIQANKVLNFSVSQINVEVCLSLKGLINRCVHVTGKISTI